MKRSPKGKGTTGSGGGGARNGWGRTRARVPARREDLIFGCVLVDLFRCCAERADEPAERTLYFLSHYHSDHTAGLGRTWRGPAVHCSAVTAALLGAVHGLPSEVLRPLPLATPEHAEPTRLWARGADGARRGVDVWLVDANHCPGAALFVFRDAATGAVAVHTGDFRYDERAHAVLAGGALQRVLRDVACVHLDTTFCDPRYDFPPQARAVRAAADVVARAGPHTLVLVAAYTIGKERLLLGVARACGVRVAVDAARLARLRLLGLAPDDLAQFTTDGAATHVHAAAPAALAPAALDAALAAAPQYRAAALVHATGWAYPDCRARGVPATARRHGRTTVYGVPYSEHSSFSELRRFVRFLRPRRIVPLVVSAQQPAGLVLERLLAPDGAPCVLPPPAGTPPPAPSDVRAAAAMARWLSQSSAAPSASSPVETPPAGSPATLEEETLPSESSDGGTTKTNPLVQCAGDEGEDENEDEGKKVELEETQKEEPLKEEEPKEKSEEPKDKAKEEESKEEAVEEEDADADLLIGEFGKEHQLLFRKPSPRKQPRRVQSTLASFFQPA